MSQTAVAVPEHASCALHPENPATGTCARCGRFVCHADSQRVELKLFCLDCAQRPEVDYLEGFRLKFWGKRDAWAWLMGVGGIINTIAAVGMVVEGQFVPALSLALWGAVEVAFFFRVRFARWCLPVLPLLSVAENAVWGGPLGGEMGELYIRALIGVLFSLAIIRSTRNQLFFRIQPTPQQLRKAWNLYANNSIARMGFILSLLGILAFPIGPVALLCSVLGLRNVNPNAHPPIGRKGQAMTGIVLGTLETLGLVAFVVFSFLLE
ncbi:MAG: hypothetical protein WBV82_22915 [Myxococcaceae bacterium]